MRKLPNYQEYLELPEYLNMVSLLEKGIAIHHAGVMPVLREMVELLYAKGYIKLLFATETFAVGINMPTKTTMFTSLEKFDGTGMRMLYSHEYTQMAGRAGRRGLDKVGNVIHLNNLFKNMNLLEYKQMMCGKPQTLISKFKISYNLILNLIDVGDKNFTEFAKRSMIQSDIDAELGKIYYKMADLQSEIDKSRDSMNYLKTPKHILEEHIDLTKKCPTSTNKKRKDIEKRMQDIRNEYFSLDNDLGYAKKYISKEKELVELEGQFKHTEQFLNNNVLTIVDFLKENDFIKTDEEGSISLTFKGSIASHLREIHCLAFANILEQKSLEDLDPRQLVAIFSCFANITTSDEKKMLVPYCEDKRVQNMMLELKKMYELYMKIEDEKNINTGTDYNMQFDIMAYVMEWCDAENVTDCKLVLQKMEQEKDIFLGEFVKALLKINNISSEMEKICETMGSVAFLSKLREIPNLTLKFVATNQSLYV
jgi:superfamily II RNA helicase